MVAMAQEVSNKSQLFWDSSSCCSDRGGAESAPVCLLLFMVSDRNLQSLTLDLIRGNWWIAPDLCCSYLLGFKSLLRILGGCLEAVLVL